MTTLIDLTLPPPLPEPEPLAGGTFFAPLPLLHAASASARALTPASSAVVRLFIPFPPAVSPGSTGTLSWVPEAQYDTVAA
jgi:hypothetical protein